MKNFKKYIPLTESTYLILLSLVAPLHGYGIMQQIEDMSGGRVKMGPGTLYGGLTALVGKKLIRRLEEGPDNPDRKKLYEITALGRQVLETEYSRLKELIDISNRIMKRE